MKTHSPTFKLLMLLGLLFSLQYTFAQSIAGDTTVCNGSYKYYTFPTIDSLDYTWQVTGGSQVSVQGDSLEVIWTTNHAGSITLTERYADTIVHQYSLAVTLFPLPQPDILPSFLSNCKELIVTDGPKEDEEIRNSDCFVVCDSMSMSFYAKGDANSTFTWEVLGAFDTLYWENDSIGVYWTEGGEALVALTERTINGCEQLVSLCLDVQERPNATFEINNPSAVGNTLEVCQGQQVQFTNTTSLDNNSMDVGWYIDGVFVASGPYPFIHFDESGTYEVAMVVNTECNCADTAIAQVTVSNLPVADVECPGILCEGDSATYYTNTNCSPYNFYVIGSNNYSVNGNEINVVWDNVPASGYGQIILDGSSCEDVSPDSTIIDIPVITANATITGPQVVCAQSDYLNYHVPFWPGTFYEWTIVSQNGNAQLFNENTPEVALQVNEAVGEIILQVAYYNDLLACGGVETINIRVGEALDLIGPKVVCAHESFTFEALPDTSSNPYIWSINEEEQVGQTSSSFTHSIDTAGEYIVIVENVDFCNRAGRGLLVLDIPPSPQEIIGEDTICIDNYYTYTTEVTHPDYYIEWMLIDGTDTIIDQGEHIGYKFNSNGPYQVRARQYHVDNPNCHSEDLLLDIYRETPFDIEILGKDTVCANFTDIYTSNLIDGKDYLWTISNANVGSIFNATSDSIEIQWNNLTNPVDVALYLQATTCGNVVRDTLDIHVQPGPEPHIAMTGDLCVGETISFEETNINTGAFTWSTSPTATIISSNGNNFEVRYNTPGTHFVNVAIENPDGCITIVEDVISFDINPAPVAQISKDTGDLTYCLNEYDSLGVNDILVRFVRTSQYNPNYEYQWYCNGSPMAGTVNQDILTITSSNICIPTTSVGTASYQLQVTDTTTGCSNFSNQFTIILDSCDTASCISEPINMNADAERLCDSVYFTSSVSPSQFFYSVQWTIGAANANTNQQNFGHRYTQSGIYEIENDITFYSNDGTTITDSSLLCTQDTVFDIAIPAIPDFEYTFACDGNNDMQVAFDRTTDYVAVYTSFDTPTWLIIDSATSTIAYNGASPPTNLAGGTYYVTLTEIYSFNNGTIVINDDTCSITKTIHVPEPAEAAFTFAPSPVCEGTPVFFTDQSTGDIIRWEWDYGDGSSSLLQNSVRTYGANSVGPPAKNVVLTVKDKYGCESQYLNLVSVNPDNFYQVIAGDSIACYGDKVVLETIVDIRDNDYDSTLATTPISYQWSTGGTADTIHVSETGNYSVELQDAFGCIETATFPVLFFNPPAATITGPKQVCSYANFELEGPQHLGSLTYLWEHSTDSINWNPFSNQAIYYGEGNEDANNYLGTPFTWTANQTHYIRLVINTAIAGVLSCPDTSEVFLLEVLAPLDTIEFALDYTCELPVTIHFDNADDFPGADYHWSTGAVNIDSIRTGFTGLYAISLRDSFGCSTRSTFDFVALPKLNDLSCGCVEICDTLLPAQVNTHVTTDQDWILLHNGSAIDSGYGVENLTLNLNNLSASGTYSLAIGGTYYDVYCTDTLEDFLDLIVLDCCPDSVWASIDFIEDTICNNTIPLIDIDFNYNGHFGVPIFDFYGEIDSTALDDGVLNCYDELGENIVPIDFGELSDTLIEIYVIPHNGDSLANATCIGDTVWATVYFEPCGGCDSLGLAPYIKYEYSNGYLQVTDESESAYGYHLVEMWYGDQYYSGAPHSVAQFELENINECDTLYYTISYFLDDICCTATCYEYICLDCEDIDMDIYVESSLTGNTWDLAFNASFPPTYLSWTFPDGTQQAGNVLTNPSIANPSYIDNDSVGGQVCVIASIKLGIDTAECGTVYTKCCNVEHCFPLNSEEWYTCDELYDILNVDSYMNPDGNYGFILGPDSIFNLPHVNVSYLYWDFGDGNSSYAQYPNHSYLCSSTGDTTYYGQVSFNIGAYHDGIYSECKIALPFQVSVAQCGSSKQAKIYPNPASNTIYMSFTDMDVSQTSYKVYSDIGKEMYKKQEISQAIERLDISTWSRGVYTIVIKNSKESYMKKCIKK